MNSNTKSNIVLVNLEMELPEKSLISRISVEYSNYQIKVISIIKSNHLIQIEGYQVNQLKLHSNYAEISIIDQEQDYILLNIKTEQSKILNTLSSSTVHLIYPLIITKGKLLLEIIAQREEIDKWLNKTEEFKIKTKIQSIGQYTKKSQLTAKQLSLLRSAFDQGYFEIPRKIDMKGLANQFNVSKSALSEMFRRAIKNLLRNTLKVNKR
ncbi:MAG: hypothetical protein GF311_08260 [Candidatus Lokiarchaeota archaeon]|nr:hypothetical protein [Candidatus Lokiarchaeota archaeon]